MTSVPGAADLEAKNQYWIDLGVSREREATFKWLVSRTLSGGDIETHSQIQRDYLFNVLKPEDPTPYLERIFYKVDPVQQELARIIKLLENSDSACSAWAIALIKGEVK